MSSFAVRSSIENPSGLYTEKKIYDSDVPNFGEYRVDILIRWGRLIFSSSAGLPYRD